MTSEEDTKQQPSETPEEETPAAEASAPAEPAGDTAEQPAAPADEAAAEEPAEPLQPLDVYALLQLSFAQLAAAAWQKMGLQPDPFTNTIVKDIDQARLAIDAAADLLKRFQPRLQGQEARDYQTMLTDLRLNFVKQSETHEKPD
jgi:hypothetical protein